MVRLFRSALEREETIRPGSHYLGADSCRKILFVMGTRPEAIKLCPILVHLRRRSRDFEARLCVTGQHRTMLDQVLAMFRVSPITTGRRAGVYNAYGDGWASGRIGRAIRSFLKAVRRKYSFRNITSGTT